MFPFPSVFPDGSVDISRDCRPVRTVRCIGCVVPSRLASYGDLPDIEPVLCHCGNVRVADPVSSHNAHCSPARVSVRYLSSRDPLYINMIATRLHICDVPVFLMHVSRI